MPIKAVLFALIVLLGVGFVAGSAIAQEDGAGYSIQDVTACSHDAMRLCKDKMPDVGRIEQCMREHFDELRPKCKARFNR